MNEIEAIKELERTDRYITRNPTNYGDNWGEASDAIDLAIEALKEKQERDNKCEDCINYVCNTFGMACYECGRYYADGFKPKEV